METITETTISNLNPEADSVEIDIQRQQNWLRYAKFTMDELEKISNMGRETIHIDRPTMLRMPFRNRISHKRWENVLDWSHSNMSDLFDTGYDTAQDFIQENWQRLGLKKCPPRPPQRSNTTINDGHSH